MLNDYNTTQVKSAFRARSLASSEVIHLQAAEEKQNGFPFHIKLL